MADFRTLNAPRSHAFPPHSLVKILSTNDEEEDSKERISKQRTVDYPMHRNLLSNNPIDKDNVSIASSIASQDSGRKRRVVIVDAGEPSRSAVIDYIGAQDSKRARKDANFDLQT